MVPLNGAFVRFLCKCLLLLSVVFLFFFWSTSQQNQSSVEVGQLEQQLTFSRVQLDSLQTQIEVITRHKQKIEHLLEEQREHFAKKSEDQEKRILHLKAENNRLSKINREWLDLRMNNSNRIEQQQQRFTALPIDTIDKNLALLQPQNTSTTKLVRLQVDSVEKRAVDPFSEGHQLRMPPLPEEEKIGIKSDLKNGVEAEREDIGAEKDYIFAREKPREDLVFSRRENGDNGTFGQPFSRRKLMEKVLRKNKEHKEKAEEEEEEGKEKLGVMKANG